MIFRSRLPTLPIPNDASIWKVVEDHARTIGNKKAFICGITEKSLTFAELLEQSTKVCAGLAANGLKKGDVVILHSFNCLEELADQIEIAEAVAVISHKKFAKVAVEAAGLRRLPLSQVYTLGQAEGPSGHKSIEGLIAQNLPFPNIPPIDTNQVVTLPFSSGTTGRPKGVELTARAMYACGILPAYREDDLEYVLGMLPFFHIMATMIFHVTIYKGVTMVVLPGFDPETFLRSVAKYKMTKLNLAPPLVTFLAKHPIVDKYDLSHVLQGYGMTEFAGCATSSYPTTYRDGASGTLHPNTELKVKDLETDEDLGVNQTGELLFRTPALMKGYYKNPEANRVTFTTDGFVRTGDVGYIDEDGYIFIVDRLKELIKYKGHQVAPAEVEDVVNSHPKVSDSGCVRGFDPATGEEIPKAFVVLKEGEKLSEEELMEYVAGKVTGYKRVREVEFIDVIPKSLSAALLSSKGVELTARSMYACGARVSALDVDADHILAVLPFFHIAATMIFHVTIFKRIAMIVLPRFEPGSFLRAIENFKLDTVYVVPPIIQFLAKHPLVDKYDLSSLNRLASGAAPLGDELVDAIQNRLELPVLQSYGMTELAGSATHSSRTEYRVDLPVNQRGELVIRSPGAMKGYFNNPEATRETFTDDGFICTGDVGYIDQDGYIFIVDRLKELIKYKGHQVAPAELEDVVNSHPQVADSCCVRGIDLATGDEIPKVFVVRKFNEDEPITPSALMGFVVILHSFNCLEYIVVFLALNRLGAICSPSSPLFNGHELANQIKTAEVRSSQGLGRARAYTKLRRFVSLIAMDLPFPDIPPVDRNQFVTLPFSSGTTGRPKGVELTARAMYAAGMIPGYRESKTEPVLGMLPFFHIMMTMNFHVTLYHGKPMIVLPGFTPDTFLRTVEKYKLDMVNLAPPLVTFLAKSPIVAMYDLSHVKHVKSGGAPLGKEVERAVMQRLGIQVLQGYGMTEFVGCGCRSYPTIVRAGSSGTLHPNTELKVKDLETGEDLPANKTGELLFRTPAMMKGYYKNPEATCAAFTEDGFLRTGDLGYIDDDGYIFIVDRLKELIKYKGHQVAPAEVEDVVNSHPLVADSCCVRGRSLETGEETPKAFVVLKEGEKLTSEALIAFVAAKVADYKRVREVEFIDTIPKSLSGKILRRKLQLVQDKKMQQARASRLLWGYDTHIFTFAFVLDFCTARIGIHPTIEMVFSSPHGVIPIPKGKTAWDWVEEHAVNIPNKPAYICAITNQALTFADVHDQARKICAALAAEGIKKGDMVDTAVKAASIGNRREPCLHYWHADISVKLMAIECVYSITTPCIDTYANASNTCCIDFRDMLARDIPFPNLPPVDPEAIVAMPFSSGTTARPKGVLLTGRALFAGAIMAGHSEKDMEYTMTVLPFFHIMSTLLFHMAFYRGWGTVILPKFMPDEYLSAIVKYKVWNVYVAPPIVQFFAKHPIVDKYDLSCLKYIGAGGAPMGLSHGEELGANDVGELLIHTPAMMEGYYKNLEETKKSITEDGFVHTGDVGYIDNDGFIFIVDRVKEMIKYKGHQVAPAELEDVLHGHPTVVDSCCVRGKDLESGEEIPKAFVVLREGSSSTLEEIMEFVSEKVAPDGLTGSSTSPIDDLGDICQNADSPPPNAATRQHEDTNHNALTSSSKPCRSPEHDDVPRAVMELVLSFAVKNVSDAKVLPTKRRGWRRLARPDKTPLATIAEWRLVCHYWRDLLGEILAQYQQRTVKLNLSHKSTEEQTAILKDVNNAGLRVIELRVALFGHTTRRVGTDMTQVVDWQALLSSCPNLQRLDVSKMAYLTRRDLAKVLDAASQYCLKMKAVVLPLPMRWSKHAPKIVGAYRNDIDDVALIKHLSAALERWFVRGHCGGLRQLVIPHIPALSNQFLTAITRFCPNVEILDGWKLTYVNDGWGAALCDEEWRQLIRAWSLQAAAAVELASESEISSIDNASRPYSSAGLCSLVRGLPFLRSFKVFLHPRHRIDLDVFDDDFLRQFSKASPYLGQFSFSEAGKYAGPQALECVSDQGLLSLASMTHLSDISIAALSRTSGDGVFPFIQRVSSIIQQRNVKIGVMQDFDKIILPLLELVAREPAGSFTSKAFALMLVNVGHLRDFTQKLFQPQEWEGKLQEIRYKLESNHPTVRFQLTMEQEKPSPGTTNAAESGDDFSIAKFSVFTTDWKYQDVTEGTFYRGDITNSTPFKWIICSFAAAPELIPLDIDTSDINHSAPNFATHLTEPSTLNLQRLARVCRAWRDIVAEFCAEHEATRVMTLQFTTGHEREQEKRINKFLSAGNNGEKLLDLRIIITAEKRVLWWDLDAETQTPTPGQAEDLLQWVEWSTILKKCPNLRRLDLTGVPLHHLAMGDLLDATSTYCKHLEALILPKKYKLHADAVADNVDFVLWRLYLALEKWHEASGGNGLRQLTVPSRSEFDREMASNEFLTTVLRFCPRLEYLDGWKRSYSEGTRLVASDESLCVSRDVWKVFCKSCVMLREFSWVIVPFSDEFFLPFGQTTKPFLTRLQLTYNTRAPFRIRRNEYSTGGLNVLLAGCPASNIWTSFFIDCSRAMH
ncbi:Leucine-rich repeat domain, L domain-like [Phytophthora cactorum]|nr:Leucine-rich repeat domain, L domain-like [Phytophthora cactorum]